MNQKTADRILDIQEQIRSEKPLMEEYEHCQTALLNMLPALTESQQNILLDYLGVWVEIHLRMLELCCKTEQQK